VDEWARLLFDHNQLAARCIVLPDQHSIDLKFLSIGVADGVGLVEGDGPAQPSAAKAGDDRS